MRNLLIVIFLAALCGSSFAVGMEGGAGAAFIKADFKKEIAYTKLRKLLGGDAGHLVVAKQDGAVEVLGEDGVARFALPQKEGDTTLLKQPEAAAIETGTVYVADAGTNQVVMYGLANGKYLGRFGAKASGFFSGGDGNELDDPRGIAVQDGVVYVADTGNKRVQMFGVNGVFLQTLPLSAQSTPAAGKEASYALKEPADIGLDETGRIYVLDSSDHLVKVYAPSGQFLKVLPNIARAASMRVAEDGIYVADDAEQVIAKFDFAGKLAYNFGSKGEGKGQFKKISGLAIGKAQQIYVGDADKSVAHEFLTVAGARLEPIPKAAGRTSVSLVASIPVEAAQLAGGLRGGAYAISKDGKALLKLAAGKVAGEIKPGDMVIAAATVDADGAIWALDKANKQGVRLDQEGKVLLKFGSGGSGAGQFSNPSSIAVSPAGLVFVADTGNASVQVFRNDGVYLAKLGGSASPIANPLRIVAGLNGNLFVLDGNRNSVMVFSPAGDLLAEFGKLKEGNLLAHPTDMTVTANEVLVLDGSQIKVFSQGGVLLRTFGSKQTGAGALTDASAITAVGDSGLYVIDHAGKSVYAYTLLYKPDAPQQFTAQGGVHAIELKWGKAEAPYVKQFRVYRSREEGAGFVQIATAAGNAYTDANLDADMKYFYRVAALSDQGYEGATSAATTAVSQKFTPAPLLAARVETTPWQVKLAWDAAPAQYLAAYRIYQKEGEDFVKLGEVNQPGFVKEALAPETKYTFYLTVVSTDGVESEKLPVEATTQVFNRPPLDIEVVKLENVFSNSYKLYERDGIGRIRLSNNTNKPMEKIRVSFVLKNFMDYPTETKIDKLRSGESTEIPLKAVFNNSILTVTEDTAVQVMIEASYYDNGKKAIYNRNETVNVYDKHRLTWDQRERFATFITPKDPPILNLVRAVVSEYGETKDDILLAAGLFDALGVYGITYIQDPTNPYQISSGKTDTVDYIQFPRETLERKSGDCDDLVAFYSAGLESMGINTRVLEVPGHMLMMFSTGMPADEDGYTMDNLYVIYEGVLWVPVETTLLGSSFIKAWENGSATYYKNKDKGLTILDVHHAWENFKPASLPDSEWKPSGLTRAAIDKKFPGDHLSVLKISSQTRTRRYLDILKGNPSDIPANLQMGIILAKIGDAGEAMKYFNKVIALDTQNAAALNNRGNLLMIEDKFQDAQKDYLAALKASPEDAQVWVNLARAYKRAGNTKKAKAAFVKAQGLDPKIKDQYRALALELLNAL